MKKCEFMFNLHANVFSKTAEIDAASKQLSFFVTLTYKKTRVHKLTSIFTKCNAELNTINMTLTYFQCHKKTESMTPSLHILCKKVY